MARLHEIVQSRPSNAAVTWTFVAVLSIGALANLAMGELLWAVYAAVVAVVAAVPALLARDWTTIVSWEPLALAALPVLAHAMGIVMAALTYAAVAVLALLVAVEVDVFSTARMAHWFAVLFVVLLTLTAASWWAIMQYASDVWLGTTFLRGRVDLMWDLVAATAAGVGAGLVFELYFRESDDGDEAATPGGAG